MPPGSLMWPGQDMAMPWDVPPKCDGTCLTHLNGVHIAHAQGAAKCGNVLSDPQNGYQRYWAFTGTGTPLKVVNSFDDLYQQSRTRLTWSITGHKFPINGILRRLCVARNLEGDGMFRV